MPRKATPIDESKMHDAIIDVFRKTTQEERKKIALDWCLGEYDAPNQFVGRELLPIAVIIAALIDIEHPLLVSPGRGLMYGVTGCVVVVLGVVLRGEAVGLPYYPKVVHTLPVDSL